MEGWGILTISVGVHTIGVLIRTRGAMNPRHIKIYHEAEAWEGMRVAGKLVSKTLDMISKHVIPEVTTQHLNDVCHQFMLDHGAFPAPLEVGFPKAVCISVNDVICHGIPGPYVLKPQDIVNIDVSLRLNGWYADSCRMFYPDVPSEAGKILSECCREAFMKAIAIVKPGAYLGDVGDIIQQHTQAAGFSVVKEFCGHGIGRKLHCAPEVLHFGRPQTGLVLKEGIFFTIEPMINEGKAGLRMLKDGWTAVTGDGKLSAQWEHTLGVTAQGCEILT